MLSDDIVNILNSHMTLHLKIMKARTRAHMHTHARAHTHLGIMSQSASR